MLWNLLENCVQSRLCETKSQFFDKKMYGSFFWACCLLASVVGIRVETFSPGQSCGGAIEIQTVRSSGNVVDGAGCQLIRYNDQTDVIPLPANLEGE